MLNFDNDNYKMIDEKTGKPVGDKRAKYLIALWRAEYKIIELEDEIELIHKWIKRTEEEENEEI